MRLRYTRPALADLDAILEYVTRYSGVGARRIHARIREITDLLVRHPRVGLQTDDPVVPVGRSEAKGRGPTPDLPHIEL